MNFDRWDDDGPPPATEAQIDYLRGLLHKLGWPHNADLDDFDELAEATCWDDLNDTLENLDIAQASELIESLKALCS